MEDKEKVAERVRRYREKKKVPKEIERLVDPCMPLISALQSRVTVLESEVKALQAVTSLPMEALKRASTVAEKVVSKGVGKPALNAADLFARVVAEKEARLGRG